jgi:hypothetical protein
MPEKDTVERARKIQREGKSPGTQAGKFVREEMHQVRKGKHDARSTKQAVAIGLTKAHRAGVKLGAPRRGRASAEVRQKAQRDLRKGRSRRRKISPRRSRAISGVLKRDRSSAASKKNLARQARAAMARGAFARHQAAKDVRTKGKPGMRRAAQKATRTRARHRRAA